MTDPFWSNWALVLIGLGIAILAIRSLRVIYDQTIATERAVASAEKIAVAADATLKVVKETAERELRAYVLPIKGGMFEDRIHAGKSSIRITIKNIGKTPAFHFSSCLSVGVFEFPTPDNLPSVTASRGKGSFPLAPDGETELEGILAVITPEQLAHLAARTKAVYAFGELRYQDAFGAERRTKFRMFCNGEWLAKGRFLFSGEGNEAD